MWNTRKLNQFCSAFCFPQKTRRRRRGDKRTSTELREMWAWCKQTMINTVPSPQTPNFLDVILGTDNRPALCCSHTCAWMCNRAGREGGGGSHSVWKSDTQTERIFFSPNLPHCSAGCPTAKASWIHIEATQAICCNHLVCACALIAVFIWAEGGLILSDWIFRGLLHWSGHARVTGEREMTSLISLPVMLTSTMPVRVPMPLVASQTYVPAKS